MKTVEEHLMNLIRIPSTSCLSNKAMVDYANAVLREAGWNCAPLRYEDENGTEKLNLIAAPPGQDTEQPHVELAFLCHTDTVPPAADWRGALQPFEKDGILYGCGSCDVKGFLACLLTAASEIPSHKLQAGLRIVLTADEEIGCLGSHRLLSEGRLRPRRLVVGEPTSLHPASAGKGYCLGEVTVLGFEAHSAHPKRGKSAIFAAACIVLEIESFAKVMEKNVNPFFDPPYTTINIGTISGGTAKNIVPARCQFLVEWRPIPGFPDPVPDAIAQILRRHHQADSEVEAEFNITRQQQGFQTKKDAAFVSSMEQLTGKSAVSIPFGSEASVFANQTSELVVFGPGDMRTAHSPRECVPTSELHDAVRCVSALMVEHTGSPLG